MVDEIHIPFSDMYTIDIHQATPADAVLIADMV